MRAQTAKSDVSAGAKSQRCDQTCTVFADVLRLYTDYNSRLGGVGEPLETVIGRGGRREVLLVAAVESVRRDAEQLDDRLRDGKTGQYQ